MCFQRMLHSPARPPRAVAKCSIYKKPHLFVEPCPRFTGQFVNIRCLPPGSVIHSIRYDFFIALITMAAPLSPLSSRPHTGSCTPERTPPNILPSGLWHK